MPACVPTRGYYYRPIPTGLHLCNKTSSTIWAAYAIARCEGCNDPDDWFGGTFVQEVSGWWQIAPGQCKTPIGYALNNGAEYFLYAHDSLGHVWRGNYQQNSVMGCVSRNAFTYVRQNNGYNPTEQCAIADKHKFGLIPSANYSSYTWSMLP